MRAKEVGPHSYQRELPSAAVWAYPSSEGARSRRQNFLPRLDVRKFLILISSKGQLSFIAI